MNVTGYDPALAWRGPGYSVFHSSRLPPAGPATVASCFQSFLGALHNQVMLELGHGREQVKDQAPTRRRLIDPLDNAPSPTRHRSSPAVVQPVLDAFEPVHEKRRIGSLLGADTDKYGPSALGLGLAGIRYSTEWAVPARGTKNGYPLRGRIRSTGA